MTLNALLKEEEQRLRGESMVMPVWVRKFAKRAYAEGKKAGAAQERKRGFLRAQRLLRDIFKEKEEGK